MRRSRILTGALLVALAATLAVPGFLALRWVDQRFLGELLKDSWGRVRYQEDWRDAAALPKHLDYSWLQSGSRPILVAHALGDAGGRGQNTLSALHDSLRQGLGLLEIDVWLSAQGVLLCHHGPEAPPIPSPDACTLPVALHAAADNHAWLILDLKTDFEITGNEIARQLAGDPSARRMIFQLYHPADSALFRRWAAQLDLPGPIVTAYLSHRSASHVRHHAARIGARALTVPLDRAPVLREPSSQLALFVHPIHDCEAVRIAMKMPVAGMYVRSDLVPRIHRGCLP